MLIDTASDATIDCPTVDFTSSTYGQLVFPQNDPAGPILQGYAQGEGDTTKVLTWHQCPSDGTQISGDFDGVTCDTDNRDDVFATMNDQSWYNPLDVSKGHRGFLDVREIVVEGRGRCAHVSRDLRNGNVEHTPLLQQPSGRVQQSIAPQ